MPVETVVTSFTTRQNLLLPQGTVPLPEFLPSALKMNEEVQRLTHLGSGGLTPPTWAVEANGGEGRVS